MRQRLVLLSEGDRTISQLCLWGEGVMEAGRSLLKMRDRGLVREQMIERRYVWSITDDGRRVIGGNA